LRTKLGTFKRRAAKRGSPTNFSKDDVLKIKKAQRGKCAYCRSRLPANFQIDHIIPFSKGGSDEARNIQLTCRFCNLSKHSRDPIEFAQRKGMLL
jgi:5-methylcytosine-specific restriction endonuclease McrA